MKGEYDKDMERSRLRKGLERAEIGMGGDVKGKKRKRSGSYSHRVHRGTRSAAAGCVVGEVDGGITVITGRLPALCWVFLARFFPLYLPRVFFFLFLEFFA